MNKKFYVNIPLCNVENEIIHSKASFDVEIKFSSYHFKEADTGQGYIERMERPDKSTFITGRHAIYDSICIKGAGINEFYKSNKKRDILGGLTQKMALKEYLTSYILRDFQCVKSIAIGRLLTNKKHFFCVREHKYPRLCFKKIEDESIKPSFQKLGDAFFYLLENGIVHTSLNSENINVNGEVIDCESFFLTKSQKFVSIPITFESKSKIEFHNKDLLFFLENSDVKVNYIKDFLSLLSGEIDYNFSDEKHIHFAKISENLKLLLDEKIDVTLIQERLISGKYNYYVEVSLLSYPIKNEIKNKSYLNLIDSNLLMNRTDDSMSKTALKKIIEKVIGEE